MIIQHSHFLSFRPLTGFVILILSPFMVPDVSDSTSLFFMFVPILVNISVMLVFSLALDSTNSKPYFLASALPYSRETCLSVSLQSDLLPTTNLHMESGCVSLICLIQFSRLWKVLRSVTLQTSTTPAAPLQQVSVMVLKRSCPAVSHICILIFTPSMFMVLILKSTPIVVMCDILYSSFTYRNRMFVFPTAVSPIITSFTRQSYFSSSRRLLIFRNIMPQLIRSSNYPQHAPHNPRTTPIPPSRPLPRVALLSSATLSFSSTAQLKQSNAIVRFQRLRLLHDLLHLHPQVLSNVPPRRADYLVQNIPVPGYLPLVCLEHLSHFGVHLLLNHLPACPIELVYPFFILLDLPSQFSHASLQISQFLVVLWGLLPIHTHPVAHVQLVCLPRQLLNLSIILADLHTHFQLDAVKQLRIARAPHLLPFLPHHLPFFPQYLRKFTPQGLIWLGRLMLLQLLQSGLECISPQSSRLRQGVLLYYQLLHHLLPCLCFRYLAGQLLDPPLFLLHLALISPRLAH